MAINHACYPVLAVIAKGPVHGYDVSRILQKDIGPLWRLGKSHVYSLLSKLEKAGFIKRERITKESYPDRNVFSITEQGADALRTWITQPVYHIRDMRLEFPTKLWFAKNIGWHDEKKLIESQLSICIKKIQHLEALKDSAQTWAVEQALELRLAILRGIISFLESQWTQKAEI